jgi:Skp family chaperone for outer membrane proteins
MNLVLHRAQVALNVNEFDITQQVTEQLNKILPSVTIPPEGAALQAEQGNGKAEAAKEEPEAAKADAAKAEPAKAEAKKTPPSPKKH